MSNENSKFLPGVAIGLLVIGAIVVFHLNSNNTPATKATVTTDLSNNADDPTPAAVEIPAWTFPSIPIPDQTTVESPSAEPADPAYDADDTDHFFMGPWLLNIAGSGAQHHFRSIGTLLGLSNSESGEGSAIAALIHPRHSRRIELAQAE